MKRNLRNWSILDAQGQPMKRGVVAAENPNGMQTYNAHPAVGLTTESLLSFYRQAETGNPIRQMDMFDDLNERDGEVRGMFNDRIEDVVGWEYEIIPPPARTDRASVLAAGELNDRLQSKIEFRQFLAHQLGAIGDGYASTNMIWDYDDGIVVPTHFYNVAPRRFGAPSQKEAHRIMLINGESAVFGLIPLEEGLWATTRYRYRNPYAAGLRRSTSWWSMFKLVGFKQFQVWVDMYGLPLAIGYYQLGASPESRQALDDAVRGIGTDGYALLSDETELTIKETSAGAGGATVHRQLIEICDAINTKLITGGSLNTGSGSAGPGKLQPRPGPQVAPGRDEAPRRAPARGDVRARYRAHVRGLERLRQGGAAAAQDQDPLG
jgi:phage gp29-like protein